MLKRIQRYLRAVTPVGREQAQIGPFLATFSLGNTNPFLNYALPDDCAQPTDQEIAGLVDAYTRRRLRPRLEYIPDCAPAVEQRLIAAGFCVEGRLPVMVTDTQHPTHGEAPPGITLKAPSTDDELYSMAVVQAEAYNAPELLTPDVVSSRRAALSEGELACIAVDQTTDALVGGGICSRINDGLTEVAAIAVSADYRRRGIGSALASHLGSQALAAGAEMPWLMAGHDAERRAFERAGYRVIGEILHISQ